LRFRWITAYERGYFPGPHKDPFDRMLIAQSQAEGVPILSNDAALDGYGVRRVCDRECMGLATSGHGRWHERRAQILFHALDYRVIAFEERLARGHAADFGFVVQETASGHVNIFPFICNVDDVECGHARRGWPSRNAPGSRKGSSWSLGLTPQLGLRRLLPGSAKLK